MDKIVLDIETKNSFADVGGQQFIKDLQASFVGAYSYNKDKYFSFFEDQFKELEEFLKGAGLIVGFGLTRFDVPVMDKYFEMNFFSIPRLDILDEIEMTAGRRISLNLLAKTNVGMEKTYESGLEAIRLYKEGKMEELEKYCLQDVRVTKEVYDLAKKQGYLLVPNRVTGENERVNLNFNEGEMIKSQSLF
ncbi:MAG: ribonuclease H-like domain-containing protein [Candidatus Paceibacterota bacterium]